MNDNLTIAAVAKEVGISAKTIRYYESIGLFKPLVRKDNKYRTFSEKDIQRLKLIRRARDLGIPLNEVRNIVSECIDKGCLDAKKYVATNLPQYIVDIDEKIAELKFLRGEFEELNKYYKNSEKTWVHKKNSCCEILEVKKD